MQNGDFPQPVITILVIFQRWNTAAVAQAAEDIRLKALQLEMTKDP